NECGETQVYGAYTPENLRTDGFMLGVDGTIQGHKIAPVRSSSAVALSVQNGTRGWVANCGTVHCLPSSTMLRWMTLPPRVMNCGTPNGVTRATERSRAADAGPDVTSVAVCDAVPWQSLQAISTAALPPHQILPVL